MKGIEPSSLAWEASALPLSYTRGAGGIVRRAALGSPVEHESSALIPGMRDSLQTVRGNGALGRQKGLL